MQLRTLLTLAFVLAALLAHGAGDKVLFVLSGHTELGDTGTSTGYYLSEVTHPYYVLRDAGYPIDFASPKGGAVQMDPKSRQLDDDKNAKFVNDKELMERLQSTLAPSAIDAADYRAIFFAGGHGAMWDFPGSDRLAELTAEIYEAGGIVAAVCHGPAGLVNVTLSDGRHLLAGKRVTGFTNEEEAAVNLTETMPFLLEDTLEARGATFAGARKWQEHVVVSGRVVTGQNPASATAMAEAMVKLLRGKHPQLHLVAESERQWTGIAVSQQGRIFVNYPRWSDKVPFAVGVMTQSGTFEPYPNAQINSWEPGKDPATHFVCVQSVVIDDANHLWVLDPANPQFQGVVENGPKLVEIDLETNRVLRTIPIRPPAIHNASYLNDVRIDRRNKAAYISDSGRGGIIVVDLETNTARRLLDEHPSTMGEATELTIDGETWRRPDGTLPIVHSDGIALTANGVTLYYQALTSRRLYSIRTELLRRPDVSAEQLGRHVQFRVESGANDGILFGPGQWLYLSSLEYDAIRRWKPGTDTVEVVVQDQRIAWPDTFAFGPDGWLYFTTSQIHRGANPPEPYRIFRVKPE